MDHILVVRFGSLGDVILATSVVDAARRIWPNCGITFVVKEEYSPVLEQNPGLSQIVALDPDERGLRHIYRLGRELRGEGIDLVLDLQGGVRGWTLAAVLGARRRSRVRSRSVVRRLMVARPSQWRREIPHAVDRYLECLVPLAGGEVFTRGPRVWLTDVEVSRARSALGGRAGAPVVALAPGAKWRAKRWPERYFARTADALTREGISVAVLGSVAEEPLLERIVEAVEESNCVSVVSGSIRELAASFGVCSAAVCNDSGLMHLAAAVGTPVAGIFGPTAPHFGFTPYGSRHEVLWLGLPCSPCSLHGEKPCRVAENAPCLEGVGPEVVIRALRRMLKESCAVESARAQNVGRDP